MSLKRTNEALSYYNKGICCLQTGQFEEAITQLRIATHLNPKNPDALAALCLAAHEAESDDLLFHTSLMTLLDFPDGPAISRGMAINSYQIGFYPEAIVYTLKSQVICPNDVLSTYILGRSYLAAQMFEEAKCSLRRALELEPDFAVVRSLLNWLVTYLSVRELDRIPIVDTPGMPLHKYPSNVGGLVSIASDDDLRFTST